MDFKLQDSIIIYIRCSGGRNRNRIVVVIVRSNRLQKSLRDIVLLLLLLLHLRWIAQLNFEQEHKFTSSLRNNECKFEFFFTYIAIASHRAVAKKNLRKMLLRTGTITWSKNSNRLKNNK